VDHIEHLRAKYGGSELTPEDPFVVSLCDEYQYLVGKVRILEDMLEATREFCARVLVNK
jgi:hypothetical protein